ncbi:MAG: NADH-quinone oxidoreductase subunit M [Verrucomicrobia bacterium]|nr:NADH-quinone oxidoreductase subunit M [Verrucomicrobiota bacterium]MBS0637163.1 NADH-quinone oxidoreductase subunit M [Verrucomicrobiota bacterium]
MKQKLAFVLSLIPLLALIFGNWNGASFDYVWIKALSVHFHLGVDNLSLIFLYLVAAIVPIAILSKKYDSTLFYGLIFLTEALLIGLFTARDLITFIFFFEAVLIPLYFLIAKWGDEKAAFTFIIYMIAGSSLMIAGALGLYLASGSFDMNQVQEMPLLAFVFLLAFAVKTPLFPFHAWLPDAYSKAPVPVTILLSALLSKAGVYGILRVSFGIFPATMQAWSPILLILAIIGVLYGAFCAWSELDYKRLIAYSSFSHVNFILAGLFVWNSMAQNGAILAAVNHAITITALFLVASWLEMRIGTTKYGNVSGLTAFMPKLAWLTLFFVLSSVALPGLNNFVSEAMVLYGLFQQSIWLSATLGLTVIFSVIYMLRWFHSVYFDAPKASMQLADIQTKEFALAIPLVAAIVWLGIYPGPILALIMGIR